MKKIRIIAIIMLGSFSSVFAKDWSLPGITIVTREQRWANEAIRFSKMPYAERKAWLKTKNEEEMKRLEETNFDEFFAKQEADYVSQMRNDYLLWSYLDEQKLDSSVYDFGVNFLSRPQSYHYAKNKIIVHHTAGDTSSFTGKDSVIAYLKDIYTYHSIKRWRGDIGYNFLIDPYGNIYEGRAGGESVIGAHVSRNNTPSLGISLMGNFEIQQPTDAQIKSLTALATALSKKYKIDPLAKTDYHVAIKEYPYMKSKTNYRLAGHRDAGVTSCPGKNLYAQLSAIRNAVRSNLQNGILVKSVSELPVTTTTPKKTETVVKPTTPVTSNTSSTSSKSTTGLNTGFLYGDLSLLKKRVKNFDVYIDTIKKKYSAANKITPTNVKTNKIQSQISVDTAKQLMAGNIKVLLYELSTEYTKRTISCDNACLFTVGKKTFTANAGVITRNKTNFTLVISGAKVSVAKIIVVDQQSWAVKVDNYSRVSYAKVPRNVFSGSLSFGQDTVKNLSTSKYSMQTAIVNTLPFMSYLRGIAETNDSEYPEKIKVMQLISKWYALFYLNGKNKHPSIPVWSSYNAIDNPNSFQKYVGAGLEKTLTKVYTQFEFTKNKLVSYKGNLPILPYFNCSAGFTRSGKEKRWWTDTPYIVSRIDPVSCDTFNGHGVGLSGKWAQQLAMQWWTAEEILKYYYPGVEIQSW